MANGKDVKAGPAVPDDNTGNGQAGIDPARIDTIIDWVKSVEIDKPEVRIAAIIVDADTLLESVPIAYGRPVIEQGPVAGYRTTNGGFYAMVV